MELRVDWGEDFYFREAVLAVADIEDKVDLICGKEELKTMNMTFKETDEDIEMRIREKNL